MPSRAKVFLTEVYHRHFPQSLRSAFREFRDEFRILWIARRAQPKFQALRGERNLKVHLGCGPYLKEGWVNIDLTLNRARPVHDQSKQAIYINHDLRRGLPLAENSCEMIYSSHFLEHLRYGEALRLLRDCHRLLRPGGIFRACLPNFRSVFDAYLRGDRDYMSLVDIGTLLPEVEPGTETLVDYVNYAVYQHGEHKWIMDAEKMTLLLRELGYTVVNESSFQVDIDPESELRTRYSFYMEAIK
jgi:predicted SAM-dependent methyltransferase